MAADTTGNIHVLKDDFSDFLEHSLCGYIAIDASGEIIQANTRIAEWTGCPARELTRKRFSDLLTTGSKIYYETHLGPLLRMRGFFDEVALELSLKSGDCLQVLVNAYERRNEKDEPLLTRLTILKAADRRQYEQNLKQQKISAETSLVNANAELLTANSNLQNEQVIAAVREQFIAVLGHDLRNPLSSVIAAATILAKMTTDPQMQPIIAIIGRSGARMAELIDNIMDFARARLGTGIVVNRHPTETGPVLQQVVDEIRSAWPGKIIETQFDIIEPVDCDAARIGQLLSNLLANALTHGASGTPVIVRASHKDGNFELSVSNQGRPIPSAAMEKLFHPFTREDNRASQNGLGLGLFIASEIARGHQATLAVTSDEQETRFTFKMMNGTRG